MIYIPWQKTIGGLKHYPVNDHRAFTKAEAQKIAKQLRPHHNARVVKLENGRYMVYKRVARKNVIE